MSWRKPEEAGLAARLALPFVDVLIGNQLELKLFAGVEDLDRQPRSCATPVCPRWFRNWESRELA